MLIACVARYFIIAQMSISSAMNNMQPSLEEAAKVAGVSWWSRVTGIVLPSVRPALVATGGLCFILCFRELDAIALVCPPGWTTLPVRLFTLMHYGPSQLVSALCVVSVIIVLLVAMLTIFVYTRFEKVSNERN